MTAETPDWEAEGLLEGVEDGARAGRRRLLDMLHADGVSVADLRRAVEEERLVLLPIENAITGPPELSARQIAERSGVELDWLLGVERAIGIAAPDPDDPAFTQEDVAAAERLRSYRDAGLPPDELLTALRSISAGVAKAAEVVRQLFAGIYLEPDIDEYTLARRYAEGIGVLLPLAEADIAFLFRAHLRNFSRQDTIGMAERREGRLLQTAEVAVAFADLVGFTALGERIGEQELGSVADRLNDLAAEHVVAPVRVVKALGDAVMLVSREPRPMVDTLLALVEAAAADDGLPELRAGAAWGRAVGRYGDWYGATVNLASRLTARARPGAVLIDSELRGVAGDGGLAWSEAGFKRLKGVSSPVPAWRVRRAPAQTG